MKSNDSSAFFSVVGAMLGLGALALALFSVGPARYAVADSVADNPIGWGALLLAGAAAAMSATGLFRREGALSWVGLALAAATWVGGLIVPLVWAGGAGLTAIALAQQHRLRAR